MVTFLLINGKPWLLAETQDFPSNASKTGLAGCPRIINNMGIQP